jgi:hypothetical protein
MWAFAATSLRMGQQSNKVQKKRRRVNYLKRKKLKAKTAVATAK